jgi:hypothetical protein
VPRNQRGARLAYGRSQKRSQLLNGSITSSTIGRKSAYCISFANSSDIFPDVDDLRGAA